MFDCLVCSDCTKAWLSCKIQGTYPTNLLSLSYMIGLVTCTKYNDGYIVVQDFKIQNIVGSCDVKFPIRLEGLAYSHAAFSSVSDLNTFCNLQPHCF